MADQQSSLSVFTLPAGTVCHRNGIPFKLQHATQIECHPGVWPLIKGEPPEPQEIANVSPTLPLAPASAAELSWPSAWQVMPSSWLPCSCSTMWRWRRRACSWNSVVCSARWRRGSRSWRRRTRDCASRWPSILARVRWNWVNGTWAAS